jgi:hypothetical protein
MINLIINLFFMKKIVAFSVVFLLFFLVSCSKDSQNIDTWSWKIVEEIEDPNDVTTQKWYKQRISQRETDLEKFYQSLTKFDNSQLVKISCKDYYPVDTDHFKSLYDEEQKLIQEYAKKCNDLNMKAKEVLNSTWSVSSGSQIQKSWR